MRNIYLILSLIFMVSCNSEQHNTIINIIPKPLKVEYNNANFKIKNGTSIVIPDIDGYNKVASYLHDELKSYLNVDVKITNEAKTKNCIIFKYEPDFNYGKEGYSLESNPKNLLVTSNTPNGAFYGVQTILQLLKAKKTENTIHFNNQVPGIKIIDQPRFKWRGMHLDVCRHYFDKEFVKKYIDLLAMHKMNTFHWHLTEDQGWRIEIQKHPKLTAIGAFRSETMVDKNWDKFDGTPHGGYFSQEDVKEIVQYASDRFITIVPEIEMPGHSLAALSAYPELGCTGGPYEVAKTWGVFNDVYCAGNEKTFDFLEDVLSEVISLFPGEYIHIGGDECPKENWKTCDKCQKRIKDEGLKDEFELQSYFIRRIEKFLIANNKKLIGWDEILEGGLAPEATVMSWRGTEGGIAAAKMGHDVVMSPNNECYFDHYQADPENEPLAIGGYTDLNDVYFYEPIPDKLSESESIHILGAQANVWTEYIATEEHLEYMVLPRMCALSEVVWTNNELKDFDNFKMRLKQHLLRLEFKNYNYHPQ